MNISAFLESVTKNRTFHQFSADVDSLRVKAETKSADKILQAVFQVLETCNASGDDESASVSAIIKSSLDVHFDAKPSSVTTRLEGQQLQLLLYRTALARGSVAAILLFIRHGISLNGIWDDEESGFAIFQRRPITKSCKIVEFVLSHCSKRSPKSVLRRILLACMADVPYPVPNVEELRRYGFSDGELIKMSRIFPEWAATHSTALRSLKHLTRCVIRRQLAECLQLPKGIDMLRVPQQMKEYLHQ